MISPMTFDDVLQSAQSLPESERIRLVEELLRSISPANSPHLTELWLAEMDRRSDEIDSGKVTGITIRRHPTENRIQLLASE